RRFSNGTFQLDTVVDHIRNHPEGGRTDPVIAKIQLLRYRLQRERLETPVLLIGVDQQQPLTILEGNHRIAAAYLLDPDRVHERYRVLCGFSPRMIESCWYETNAANLWRYLRHRVRNIYDREADLSALLHSAQTPENVPVLPMTSAGISLKSK
ncbi:MAG: hypothetical protein ABI383_12160, partial [Acidobacteriaceae bacterium]